MKESKIIRRIILVILLICTAFLIYSIMTNPLGEHDIMFALAVTAGFISLGEKREKERENLKFNRATETKLLAFFEGLTNKQDTLKKLLREEMERKHQG